MKKIFSRKTYFKELENYLLNSKNHSLVSGFLKLISLNVLLKREFNENYNLGAIRAFPSSKSVLASLVGIRFSVNNLGNVFSLKKLDLTRKLEKTVVEYFIKLFGGRLKAYEGYVASGGSESNLFLMWLGKEWFKKFNSGKTILVKTAFTHYSIVKFANLFDIEQFQTGVDEKSWGIDLELFKDSIGLLTKKGYKKFFLPITIGYSSTGTSDNLLGLITSIEELEKKYKIKFFVWVDAAMQGLPFGFLKKDFAPLNSKLVKGFLVDTHKLGLTPIPSGIVIYKKELRALIEKKIDYLAETDATLLGSRPGSAVLAIWSNFINLPKSFWQNRFFKLNQQKDRWVKKLQHDFPKAQVISEKDSLTVAVIVNSSFPKLTKEVEEKYGLFLTKIKYKNSTNKQKFLLHYKFVFLVNTQKHFEFLTEITKKRNH